MLQPAIAQKIGGTIASVAVYGLLLFVPAWTLNWPRAWVLLAIVFSVLLGIRLSMPGEGALAERRRAPLQRGQPVADKLLVGAFLLVLPAYLIFIPLDVFHLHLISRPGPLVAGFGLLLVIAGCMIAGVAFRANAFAAGIVKDQSARGQVVVDTGPYRVVRHPLYSGVALIVIGVALWLESFAAALVSIVPLTLLVLRVVVEERFLRRQLHGYTAYAARVRQRLIPYLW